MYTTVIDTLRFADRLKAAGFDDSQAEGMARALGDEMAENMVTKRDLNDAVQAINTTIMTMDAKFESKFDALEPRFDAIDVKLESQHREFSGRFDALEPRFDAIDVKLESQHREFSSRLNLMFGTMALGFTLVIGLIGYSLFSQRPAEPVASTVEHHTAEVRLP